MSSDQTASGLARKYAHDRVVTMGLMRFDYEAGVVYELRDAYLAGYERATRDAAQAVAQTIAQEVPERRSGSRVADREGE